MGTPPVEIAAHVPQTIIELFHFFGPKIVFAVLCGGLVGLEREIKGKSAGIKTNILICLGSTLFTALSCLIAYKGLEYGKGGDPGRLAAQIVSGIGFLGGGAIIQSRGMITGLTTAATIWVVAALGVCIGLNLPEVAVFSSLIVVSVLLLISWFESKILGRAHRFSMRIIMQDEQAKAREYIQGLLSQNLLKLDHFDLSMRGEDLSVLHIEYLGHRIHHRRFVLDLWSAPGVKEVREA